RDEIFGPVLPLLTYRNLDEALQAIDEREKPLVLYLFTKSRRVIKEVLAKTRAGGTAINHTLIHFYQLNLPFGGIGNSGVGKGHGFFGFEAFSNARGVLEQRIPFSAIELMFPPYTRLKQKLIDLTLRWF
ncbi:MAG TPA: aldehyde dehydrogenase family protein, partial [Thermoanaerobaculia bacterium]|nr:aldehyde dehydrogenase family protein [Thermoanaerobaculia bacterium]